MRLTNTKPLAKDLIVIFTITLLITLLSVVFAWDESIAVAVHDISASWAWDLRQYSQMPAIIISVAAIALLLIWPLRLKWPTMRHIALLWLVAMIFGGGVVVHLILKEGFERPRPRETVLLGGPAAYTQPFTPAASLKGKSFPSGHVVMGIAFAIPFFSLRRKRKKLARAFLAAGITYGAIIGFARMTLGAHFFTDVLWSIAIMLASGAIAAHFIKEETDLKTRYFLPFLIILAIGIALFNKFSLALNYQTETKEMFMNIPCEKVHITQSDALTTHIKVDLKGYGSPLSNLTLDEQGGEISLIRWKGLYRRLGCTAEIALPLERTITFNPEVNITTDKPMERQKDEKDGKISIKHRKMVDILMLKRLNAHLAMQTTPLLRENTKQIAL